jgi:hypothetical protein
VTATATVTATVTATQTAEATESEAASSPSSETTEPRKQAGDTIRVPNGVGKDYQTAQDLWRAAGLVVGPGIDATGANRLMVLDSNWVVLKQDLKAGSKAEVGDTITATVKKYSDD